MIKKIVHASLFTFVLISSVSLYAKPVTQNYLAHNSTSDFADKSHMPYANPNAPKGGILSMKASGTFNSAKAWTTKGVAMAGTNYLYDNLMSGSLNEAFTMYPLLAEKVTFDPEDKTWIVYHINPKARFWDGSEVTASDAKATFDALLSKGPMYIRNYLQGIKKVEALDKYRVKFYFADDNNHEMLLTVGQFPVFKQSSIEEGFETVNLTPLIGSGPYRLHKVEGGRSVVYKRDPNYWGRDLMINRGRFNFDLIKYVYYQSEEIAFEGFKAGQYQFREENKSRNWATAYDFPAVKAGKVKKEQIDNRNPMAMQGLVMNLRRPLFQDVRVRQALTDAFDFEWMNQALFYNQYVRANSYFQNSELEATGTPSTKEMAIIKKIKPLIPADYYQRVLQQWQLPTTNGKGYNRQQLLSARRRLLDAGFYYQDMHLYTPRGERAKFSILLPAGTALNRVILPYIRNVKRLGFDVQIIEVDTPQYIERLRKFDFDMVTSVYAQSLSPGNEQISYWGSETADQEGNRNLAGIKNPAIDKVIDGLIKAKNREEIILHTKVLDRLLRAGYYLVPMYNKTTFDLAYWQQYKHATPPTNAIGIEYWWVDKNADKQLNTKVAE